MVTLMKDIIMVAIDRNRC